MPSLASFIRSNELEIVQEWEKFAQSLPITVNMSPKELRNGVREILHFIAEDMVSTQTEEARGKKSMGCGLKSGGDAGSSGEMHGVTRFAQGFDIVDLFSEFRAFRASVLKLWTATWTNAGGDWLVPANIITDLIRFNEAVDQTLSESIMGYTKKLTSDIGTHLMGENKNAAPLQRQ